MMHFVGFKDPRYEFDEKYEHARRVWGQPDFIHRHWDQRAKDEIADGDEAVFAFGTENEAVFPFAFDDSQRL